MAPKNPYGTGPALKIEEVVKPKAVRENNPRDIALERAIYEAANAGVDDVIPFYFPTTDKPATVRLAAKTMVKRLGQPVNVGYNTAFDKNAILLSRGILSNKGRKPSTP